MKVRPVDIETVAYSFDETTDLGHSRCASQETQNSPLSVGEGTRPSKPIDALLERRGIGRRSAPVRWLPRAMPSNGRKGSVPRSRPVDLMKAFQKRAQEDLTSASGCRSS